MYKTVTELSNTATYDTVSSTFISTFTGHLFDADVLHFGISQGVSVKMSNGDQFTGSRDINPNQNMGTCLQVCELVGNKTGIMCDPTAYKSVFKLNIKLMSALWNETNISMFNELTSMGYTKHATQQESHSTRRSLAEQRKGWVAEDIEEVDTQGPVEVFNQLYKSATCKYASDFGAGYPCKDSKASVSFDDNAKDEAEEEEAEGANKNKESSADSAKKKRPPVISNPKDNGYSVDKVIRDKPGTNISQLRQWGYADADIIPSFSMSFLQQDLDKGGIGVKNIPMACEKYAPTTPDAFLKYCPSKYRGFDKELGYSPAQISGWITFQYPVHRLMDWGYTERDVVNYIKSNRDYKIDEKRAFIQQLHDYVRDMENPTDKPWLNGNLLTGSVKDIK